MRLTRPTIGLLAFFALAPTLRAEYVVLRSGLRLNVTGYELRGDRYRLQMRGGMVEVPAAEVVDIEREEIFTSLPAPESSKEPFHALIQAASAKFGVDAELVTSVMAAESNFNPKAISRRNARGLMQLMPQTAARLGVLDVFDPQQNINAGTQYLHELLLRYNNDLVLSLAAYNAGPRRVEQSGRRLPPIRETQSYVRRVAKIYATRKSSTAALTPSAALQ
jgi:soluble lytic murein transglycosylase-like protein